VGPIEFGADVLGLRLWSKQRDVLAAVERHNRVTVRSGHGVGKTLTAAVAGCWFLAEHAPALVVTTAPTFRQVKEVLWTELRRLWLRTPWGRHGVGQVNQTEIRLSDDRRAFGFTTDEPQRLQGLHCENLLLIIDEAGGVSKEIFEAARSLLTSRNSRALLIGNPIMPQGPFYESFRSPEWRGLAISCLESPNVAARKVVIPGLTTLAWVEEQKRAWGEGSLVYQARVLGEFPESGEDVLIPLRWVEAAQAREAPETDNASLRLGCDVARFGSDRTVLCLRDRFAVRHLESHVGQSTMATAGRILALARERRIAPQSCFLDDTGVGGGVTDRLHEQGFDITPVNFAESAHDGDRFANRRTEMFWRLRDALNPDAPTPDALAIPRRFAELAGEITRPLYSYTSRGQIKLESKDDIKARLGRSPDLADALALTFARRRPEPRIISL